jgi:hypothetical protein
MAHTVVQHKSSFASGSLSLAFNSNVTAGNLIVVCAATYAGSTQNTPTDNQSNTYTLAVNQLPGVTGTPAQAAIYYTFAGSSGSLTVSVSNTGGNSQRVHIYEVSGITALDATGSNFQSSATTSATVSTSGATTQASEYVIAFFAANNTSSAWTATGSFVSDQETTTNPGSYTNFSEDGTTSSTGIQTATATLGASDLVTSVIATFTGSSGTAYTSTLTASTSTMTGVTLRRAGRVIASSLSTMSGSAVKRLSRAIIAATSTAAATLSKVMGKPLTAALANTWISVADTWDAAVYTWDTAGFTAVTFSKQCGKAVVASLSTMAGAAVKRLSRAISSATSTAAAAVSKLTARALSASSATWLGSNQKAVSRALSAAASTWSAAVAGTKTTVSKTISFVARMCNFNVRRL